MKRIAITGSSGYLGSKLAAALRETGATTLGIDIRRPVEPNTDEFVEVDICSSDLGRILVEFEPDTVIHAAFVVDPIRDKESMRRINVQGTENLLDAAALICPQRLMLISSATAYGAWPDNPVPIVEDWRLRSRPGFPYAADKTEVETIIAEFARKQPQIAVSWVRPTVIGGPDMDNYLSRVMFGMPFLVSFDGDDQPVQIVHERDVVGAIKTILAVDGRGAYNVAPPDWTTISEIAGATDRWVIRIPFWFAHWVYTLGWTLRLPYPETQPDFLYFARYPWVIYPKRLIFELDYSFEYSTAETVQEIIASRAGSMPDSPTTSVSDS